MLLWTDIHLSPVLVLFCYPIQSVYILMGMCVCVCVCVFVCVLLLAVLVPWHEGQHAWRGQCQYAIAGVVW